jgi:hypothetical protein
VKFLAVITLLVLTLIGSGTSLVLPQSSLPPQNPPRLFKVSGSVIAQTLAAPRLGSSSLRVVLRGPALAAWSTEVLSAPVDEKGGFVFFGVPPGAYEVNLSGYVSAAVTVRDRDVTDVRVGVPFDPGARGVGATISVERGGPEPIFTLLLTNGSRDVPVPVVPNEYRLPISFTVPAGEWRVSVPQNSLPPGFKLQSITYGKVDLLKEPFRPNGTDTKVAFSFSAAPNAWSAVRGFVGGLGLNRALWTQGLKLTLTSARPLPRTIASMTSEIHNDGAFEFKHVFPGSYTLDLSLPGTVLHSRSLTVTDSNIEEIEISIPRMRAITGQVLLEGAAGAPRVTYLVTGASGSVQMSPIVRDTAQFQLMLTEGERKIELLTIPAGYELVSLTAGAINLLQEPLIIRAENPEIRLVLRATPNSWGRITGRVMGLEQASVNPAIALYCAAYGTPVTAPVRLDGTFELRAPACLYSASLTSGGRPARRPTDAFTSFIMSNDDISGLVVGAR